MPGPNAPSQPGGLARQVVMTVLFLGLLIAPFVLFGQQLEAIARTLMSDRASDGLAIAAAMLLLAGDPVLPTPSSLVATLLAAKVGFWTAALANVAGLCIACLFGYWLGRTGGRVLDRTGRALPPGLDHWLRRGGLAAVLLCRPVPVLAEASLILAGAAHHEPRRLLGWCCATQSILGVAYAFAGSGWGSERWQSAAILSGSVLVPLLGAAFVTASMVRSARRERARRKAEMCAEARPGLPSGPGSDRRA